MKKPRSITKTRLLNLCHHWEEYGATNMDEVEAIVNDARYYQRAHGRAHRALVDVRFAIAGTCADGAPRGCKCMSCKIAGIVYRALREPKC